MKSEERIKQALKETEILKEPESLISSSESTTLNYYVLAEPAYLEVFEDEGPETKIRTGKITWDKPKLLTPNYILKMEGFSDEARQALKMIARQNPDLAGLLYKMKYKKEFKHTSTVGAGIEKTLAKIEKDIDDKEKSLNVIIKGTDELWDVSLMKFVQDLILKSAYFSQLPDYTDKGLISKNNKGIPVVTRNLEGLPIAAREEIEQMFDEVEKGDLKPEKLKQELDKWGVYKAYEDRFLDLFRKE